MKYFEDFAVGETISFREYLVTEEEILDFARRFDPQAFHADPEAAKRSHVGGLIASGWHTGAIFMRLQCDAFLTQSASLVSPGVDELRWLAPVRPGDTLSGSAEVIECRASRSKPDRGIVRARGELHNQAGISVFSVCTTGFFARRPAA